MSNYFRYLPFAGFFFVSAIARAILLSVLPLKALSLMETAQLVSVLFFAASACGVAVSLSVPIILRKTGLHHCFLMSLFTTAVSVVLLGTEALWSFAAGMVLHVFGVTSMEVVLSLYIMQRIPRRELPEFEPLRMVSTIIALSIGPWLGIYLQTQVADWLPYLIAVCGTVVTLIYFRWLGLQTEFLPERLLRVGNPLRHISRFLLQPRLRLAWGLTLARSSWWMMFIIYTPIYAHQSGLGELMGAAIVSIGSAWTLTLPFWGWVARRYSLRRLMYMGFTVAAGMSLSVFAVSGTPTVAIVLLAFAALGATMLDGSGHVLFLRAVRPLERSEMTGVFQTYRDIANLVVPGFFAVLLKFFALPVIFVGAAGWMLVGTYFSRYIPKRM
ncbi:MAG: MFS transporter [Pseudomonadota bacterium]|nr:MFS transporter [Pseudomonadota bacterium]